MHEFAPPAPKRQYGVVALVPSFDSTRDWLGEGAVVAKPADIEARVDSLRGGKFERTIVVANRYDGIDLPDDTCRLLILDGKPFGGGLLDRYSESCRPGSEVIATRVARVIEQGLGRAVRGEKDYCVVLLTGAGLVQAVRTEDGRGYYSQQTRTQIELGLEIAELAREDIATGQAPKRALLALIKQCLARDEGWKEFYAERMNALKGPSAPAKMLEIFAAERAAEMAFRSGDVDRAVETLQALLDSKRVASDADRGWYLQEIARYRYGASKADSNVLQVAAHKLNRYLLRPREGMAVAKLVPLP
ncbi:MAG: helicase C-terminal domain-containing protein [Gemmatimonadota bacterium]|nr:helicase C-terminal domain-containing protein [Gemmatimonadota bacterium]